MATMMTDILRQVRNHLTEISPASWTDEELLDLANNGIKDLWRRINDLFQDYFVTEDATNVTLPANTTTLAGVPINVFRVVSIEPRVVGPDNPNPGLIFKPADYNAPVFVRARAEGVVEPCNRVIWYCLQQAGAPVNAPVIRIAPMVSSAVDLRLVFNQTLDAVDEDDDNPIPGESDNAVIAWTIAYARAKERDDRAPDPEWLAVYATDKNNLITQLTPRQVQEPAVVEGMFGEADDWGWDG